MLEKSAEPTAQHDGIIDGLTRRFRGHRAEGHGAYSTGVHLVEYLRLSTSIVMRVSQEHMQSEIKVRTHSILTSGLLPSDATPREPEGTATPADRSVCEVLMN